MAEARPFHWEYRPEPIAREVFRVVGGQPLSGVVPIKDTVASFREILEGKADTLPEQAFFLAGTIEDVRKNAEKLGS